MHTRKRPIWPVLVVLALAGGCVHPPWQRRPLAEYEGPPPAAPGPPIAGSAATEGGGGHQAGATGTDQEALVEVLGQLESLGELDPEARAQLLDDLRQTKPSLWPAMVQQFRAALAYRHQLQQQDAEEAPENRAGTQLVSHAQPTAGPLAGDPPQAATGQPPTGLAQPHMPIPGYPAGPPPTLGPAPAAARPVAELQRPAATPGLPLATRRESDVPSGSGTDPVESPAQPGVIAPQHDRAEIQATITAPVEQSAGQGAGAPAAEPWQHHLARVIHDLERATETEPRTVDEVNRHAALRILYLASGRRQDALRPIAGVSPALQDFWSKQLYGLATYLDTSRQANSSRRATLAKQHLCEAANRLGELGLLTVQNLALCTEVSSYGVYKAFDTLEFTPGQDVLLYAEVNNFKSEQTEKGYRTALRSSYQILNGDGHRVTHRDFAVTEDLCQNQRRDFFMRYFITLPAQIPPGTYALELTIEDTLADKIGQSSIAFAIK